MGKRNRHFMYNDCRSSSHGEMRCSICGKPIAVGRYRTYDTEKAFVNQHEACTEDDPTWAALDHQRAVAEAHHALFVTACIEFRRKWGITELDDYIPDETEAAALGTVQRGSGGA